MKIQPTSIVILGITGDLAQKKILPALYDMFVTGRLIHTEIVGFSRREFSEQEIKDFVAKTLPKDFDQSFLDHITYVQGQFDEAQSYQKLNTHLQKIDETHDGCSNKLFYLSVPPTLYELIATHLSTSGLSIPCGGEDGFARILIEKPFGKDVETAEKLDALLGTLFHESQVYRIDHYLAKESLYTIIDLHRRDPGLAKRWSNEYIEKVTITLFEKATVGSRGAFYDGIGAFRDVGQNHILQMLALVAMEIPEHCQSENIQKARADVLKRLSPRVEGIIRGQYEGYLNEPGVASDSTTETFFSITAHVDTDRFAGVPFVLASGKGLEKNLTEIQILFKDGSHIIFDVPPQDSLPAYEKILLDCIAGDQSVFTSTEEILAEWRFVSPLIREWEKEKPRDYPIGSKPEKILA